MDLQTALQQERTLFIQQKKNWVEIIVDFETANRYAIMDESQNILGMIAEEGGGFITTIKRMIFRSHRGFDAKVVDNAGKILLSLTRSFFFFFSDLWVTSETRPVGSVHRRFGIIYKKYDLRDATGQTFATIKSPIWRLWTFPISDTRGLLQGAEVTKRWGGLLKEAFTDADTFKVDFGNGPLTPQQRAILFAAAISIDFDFFEKNQHRSQN